MTGWLSVDVVTALQAGGLDPVDVITLVSRALDEDLMGAVDVTSVATVPAGATGTADVVARAGGVVAGVPLAAAVLQLVDEQVKVDLRVADGDEVAPGESVLTATGPVRSLLTGERTALNLLCHLSGIATLTSRWVAAVEGTGAVVLDTRKTNAGLRQVEKYAVRMGGGQNKRMGLSDAALIKDNHVVAAGGIREAFTAVRKAFPQVDVQLECDTVEQVAEALEVGATWLLLDNMPPEVLREAVALVGDRAETEATGGLTLERAKEYAETGVDYLSIGELTHSARVLDLGFDLRQHDPREGIDVAVERRRGPGRRAGEVV